LSFTDRTPERRLNTDSLYSAIANTTKDYKFTKTRQISDLSSYQTSSQCGVIKNIPRESLSPKKVE